VADVNKYESTMTNNLMQLSNDIVNRGGELAQINMKVSQLSAAETESNKVQIEKIKKLSKVVMAVNALETACFDRKKNIPGLTDNQKKSLLNYKGHNFFSQPTQPINVPSTFDKYRDRFDYSLL
jgi:hypothetical protein